MGYRYLLVDNDNTLMDFCLAEAAALAECMEAFHLEVTEENTALYSRINDALWKALERGEISQPALRIERFRRFLAQVGCTEQDPEQMALDYQQRLSHHGELLPGALDFLKAVAGKMKISLVTNGVPFTQRGRLAVCGFADLLDDVVISGEIGTAKPDPRMVMTALERLGCTDKSEAVLFGDSLSADIAAANAAGIDSIWYCPSGKQSDLPTRTVRSFDEALRILLP